MRRAIASLFLAALLVPVPPLGGTPAVAAVRREVVVACPSGPDQCWPTSFAFTPDGDSIFYVERYSGEVRRYRISSGQDTRWTTITNLSTEGEQGLLGLAIDPRWRRGRRFQWVYVYYTQREPLVNVIERLRWRAGGRLLRERLVRIAAASGYHNGGVIRFGPDGLLYAVTGEAHQPARAQDLDDPGGKVLRMKPNGGRPRTNPWPGSLAWSRGHRNSFGFGWDRRTGRLWQTENGPECEDEINLIMRGRNYGWGAGSDCPNTSEIGPRPVQPKKKFTPPIAITGLDFCRRCGLGDRVRGDLVFAAFRDGKIRHVQLVNRRRGLGRMRLLFDNPDGVVGLKAGPGGTLYFSDPSGIYKLAR